MLMRAKQIISHSFYKRCETSGSDLSSTNCNVGSFYGDESRLGIFVGRHGGGLIATNRPRCETLNQLQFHQIRALKRGEAAP